MYVGNNFFQVWKKLRCGRALFETQPQTRCYRTFGNSSYALDTYKKSNYTNESAAKRIKIIKDKYPLLISDAEINN